MNQKLIRQIGRSQRLDILTTLKRRGPMTVKEMAAHFEMSYMGIKQHCLDLEKEGYLDTWRRPPTKTGRPEMLYRLTRRGLDLFPGAVLPLTLEVLEAVEKNYGPAAPTKILFTIFAQRTEAYRVRLQLPTLDERARTLTRLRDTDGYMAEFGVSEGYADNHASPPVAFPGVPCIVEHHSPIEALLRRWPILARLEKEMFERRAGLSRAARGTMRTGRVPLHVLSGVILSHAPLPLPPAPFPVRRHRPERPRRARAGVPTVGGRPRRCRFARALVRWLEDHDEVDAALRETAARAYIELTCQTDDPDRERAYLHIIEHVEPWLKPRQFALQQALAAHPHFAALPAHYDVFRRTVANRVRLYREENVARETEEARLSQQYAKLCGAQTVAFEGRGTHHARDGRRPARPRPRAAAGGVRGRGGTASGRPRGHGRHF